MTGENRRSLKIVITGGGTGGHIYPALAIAKGLQDTLQSVELLYIGTQSGMEARIVPPLGIEFRTITVSGLERRFTLQNIKTVALLGKGCAQARTLLRSFKPDVVVGTGGYVCGPVVLVAAFMGIPTLIHEQNAFPGITNRILSRFVDKVCITFPEAKRRFPKNADIIETGLPVRPEIMSAKKKEAYEYFGLKSGRKTILVVGGSRGAKRINDIVQPVLKWISDNRGLQLVHVTGRSNYDEFIAGLRISGGSLLACERIKILPYLDRMDFGLAVADLVVSRAGASFLAEITAVGVPAILIPYPFASENHQEHNARSLENRGAARVLLESPQLDENKLLTEIKSALDSGSLDTMAANSKKAGSPESLSMITGAILQLSKQEM